MLKCAILIGIGLSVVADAQTTPRVRVIADSLEPISNQLRPDDEIVLIPRDFDSTVPDHPRNAKEAIADSGERAGIVAVVEIHEVGGALVEGGTWIRTRLAGVVREILRSSKSSNVALGQPIEAHVATGELRIGRVLVKAGDLLRLPNNRRYLLFMTEDGLSPGFGLTYSPLD